MASNQVGASYQIWGVDNAAYGPVELPVLVDWVSDERVKPATWIYLERTGVWTKAAELPELQMFFHSEETDLASSGLSAAAATPTQPAIQPPALRRIKLLASMSDSELATFIKYVEVQEFRGFARVVRAGEHGDSLYLILSGELRALTMVDGKESTLATLEVGDYFGEVALLDEGPRSADVIANTDSVTLKLSSDSFKKLMKEDPELALHFMYALGRSAAGKIRGLTKRYQDSIHFSRYAHSC